VEAPPALDPAAHQDPPALDPALTAHLTLIKQFLFCVQIITSLQIATPASIGQSKSNYATGVELDAKFIINVGCGILQYTLQIVFWDQIIISKSERDTCAFTSFVLKC
jgi:hypothetical protein